MLVQAEVYHQSEFRMLLFLVESKFSQEGLIRRRIKVNQWPLPSWVRPKRVTKRCNQHAKQDTDER